MFQPGLVTLLVFLVIIFSEAASAAYLVNTGSMIQGGYGGANVYASNPTTDPYQSRQFVAGQFTLEQGSRITEVQGWMANDQDGFITAAIYQDHTGLPGQRIYSDSFEVLRLSWERGGVAAGWFGPARLNWTVEAGTYWLAFEVLPSDSMFGVFPNMGGVTMQGTAPMPLNRYAYFDDTGWYLGLDPFEYDNNGYGMRISGEILAAPVPAPGAIILFGSALGACAIARRFARPKLGR